MSDPIAGQTGLLIPLLELDEYVGRWRDIHDPSAKQGVPAHITITVPFRPWPGEFDSGFDPLANVAKTTAPFDLSFVGLRSFPHTLYLAPEPRTKITRLTERVVEAYPEHPPYGGVFDEVIPHLTIGDRLDEHTHGALRQEVGDVLKDRLPLKCPAKEIRLVEFDGAMWEKRTSWVFEGR